MKSHYPVIEGKTVKFMVRPPLNGASYRHPFILKQIDYRTIKEAKIAAEAFDRLLN